MIVLYAFAAVFLCGALFGWWRAARRGLNRLDKLQYAATFGIIFLMASVVFDLLLGLFV